MGRTYQTNINPFQDFLLVCMLQDIDLVDDEHKTEIYVSLIKILELFVPNDDYMQYFDLEIRGNDGYYKVVAKNAISALWLSGIFPMSPKNVMDTNEYVFKNTKYKFNPKTNKLTSQSISK